MGEGREDDDGRGAQHEAELPNFHATHHLSSSLSGPSSASTSSPALSAVSAVAPALSSSSSSSSAASSVTSPRGARSLALNVARLSTASSARPALPSGLIVDVWQHNLRAEVERIVALVDDFPFIAMDTEFPGVVARPVGVFKSGAEFRYASLKLNADLLKLLQLGLTFADKDGNLHPGTCTWQFNFSFHLSSDVYALDSVQLLQASGLDFALHASQGIDVGEFAELLITSGLVLNPDIRWVTFHASYDFAYLLRLLTCLPLPPSEAEFFDLLQLYFPALYDVKYLMGACERLQGGLQSVSDTLQLERVGAQHTAGSDSLLTLAVFFKMRELFFEDLIDADKFSGVVFGLGHPPLAHSQPTSFNATPAPNPTSSSPPATLSPAVGKEGGGEKRNPASSQLQGSAAVE